MPKARDWVALVGGLLAAAAGFVLAGIVALFASSGTFPDDAGYRVGLWAGLWPILASPWLLACVRTSTIREPRRRQAAVVMVLAGAITAYLSAQGLVGWATARWGYWDPEFTGVTSALPYASGLFAFTFAGYWLAGGATKSVLRWVAFVEMGFVSLIVPLNLVGVLNGLSSMAADLALAVLSPIVLLLVAAVLSRRTRSGATRSLSGN